MLGPGRQAGLPPGPAAAGRPEAALGGAGHAPPPGPAAGRPEALLAGVAPQALAGAGRQRPRPWMVHIPELVIEFDVSEAEEFHRLFQDAHPPDAWAIFLDLLSMMRWHAMPPDIRSGFRRKAAGLAALHFAAAWAASQLLTPLIELGVPSSRELLGGWPYPLSVTLRGGVGAVSGAVHHAAVTSAIGLVGLLAAVLPMATVAKLEQRQLGRCRGKGAGGHGLVLAGLAANSLSSGAQAAMATRAFDDESHMMHLCVLALAASWAFAHCSLADRPQRAGRLAARLLLGGLLLPACGAACCTGARTRGCWEALPCAAAVVEALCSILLASMCQQRRLARGNPDESTCLAVALSKAWLMVTHGRIVQKIVWPSVWTASPAFSYVSCICIGASAAYCCWVGAHDGPAQEAPPGNRNEDALRALLLLALTVDPVVPQNNPALRPPALAPAPGPRARGPEGPEAVGLRRRVGGAGG